MELQALTFLIVGITFAIYVGIAFWARARSTDEFYVAGVTYILLLMEWRQLLIGCLQHHLFRWQV